MVRILSTVEQIIELLAVKHGKDVFVPECKDGPTQRTTHFRLDAWAMARSWAHPTTYGYEIKVKRGDWLRDDKWTAYLGLCSRFSFVCPWGLIDPAELPEGTGLLWLSKTGNRLFTKRRAPEREVEIPEELFRYILMTRARIQRTTLGGERWESLSHAEYWRRWLVHKAENRELGYNVSKGIRETIEARVTAVQDKNLELERAIKRYDGLRALLIKLGLMKGDCLFPPYEWEARDALEIKLGTIPMALRRDLENLETHARELLKDLEPVLKNMKKGG